MWQTILIWAIILLCAVFISRRFFRHWQAAISGKPISCCDDSACSCCASQSSCSTSKPSDTAGRRFNDA